MKAARYHPETNKCSVDDIPIPDITDDEILVKMASAGLCHSDLMLFEGSLPATEPVTMGHEGVGFVEKIGKNVKKFGPGDRIGFLYIKGVCYECEGCQVHNLNCLRGTPKLHGVHTDGFFAEYAAVDHHNAIILPDNFVTETSAPYFCAGITAFHAVDQCELKPGQWMAIVGCGGLGQMGIQIAKAMGLKVIGIDINDDVLKAASEAGADFVVNSKAEDYVEKVKQISEGGAHAAVVFSAAYAAFGSSIKILRIAGLLMIIGLPAKPLEFAAFDLMRNLYRVSSTATGPPQKMPRAVEFISKHNIKTKVATYKLEQIQEMIDLMHSGKSTSRMAVVF
ncbi:uncharacterized protein PV06_05426 [Exophiala oligosperma]|uniref:Enoyl reductase (ER) domain-containing protein n=1 Tax=Exophiala oligosperma TaxID=215243 RepID=A0A0D2E1X1_9EURO|nr:uncharacterized protein PV06_05426 [Exophiala oligosperma]KIW41819.1 hypothetical protein PV06_05426 [Exophiala oligosperma]